MMVGGGEEIELVHAPQLAEVRRAIFDRPHYLADRPIAVDHELWHHAQEQLRHVLEARGWPLLASDRCDQPNFLLCGVPVVMSDG